MFVREPSITRSCSFQPSAPGATPIPGGRRAAAKTQNRARSPSFTAAKLERPCQITTTLARFELAKEIAPRSLGFALLSEDAVKRRRIGGGDDEAGSIAGTAKID